jgi:hypothetical protein
LKNVSDLLREGELITAQGILEAAGVTTPTGNLIEGCYDEAGNLYRLPETIILDPINVIPDETMKQPNRNSNIDGETMVGLSEAKSAALDSGQVEDIEKAEEDSEATERKREEKGKASERDAVKVKCRLSDRGGPDVVILLGRSQTVGALARRIKSETDVSRMPQVGQVRTLIRNLGCQNFAHSHGISRQDAEREGNTCCTGLEGRACRECPCCRATAREITTSLTASVQTVLLTLFATSQTSGFLRHRAS